MKSVLKRILTPLFSQESGGWLQESPVEAYASREWDDSPSGHTGSHHESAGSVNQWDGPSFAGNNDGRFVTI